MINFANDLYPEVYKINLIFVILPSCTALNFHVMILQKTTKLKKIILKNMLHMVCYNFYLHVHLE